MSVTELVGTVVGPMGGSIAGELGTYTLSNFGYDFAIGGQPFLVQPNDETPYLRETDEFRKQQFDAASTPGDQSLSGLWLRGQLSFHKGAGVKYYETLEGEGVLNRFYLSTGIDPWTAGEACLGYQYNAAFNTSVTLARTGWSGSNPTVWFIRASDGKVCRHDGTTLTVVSAAAANGLAPKPDVGSTCYYSQTNGIYRASGPTQIYTSASNWAGVWWAKGRLIAIDAVGRWYALAANPTAPPIAVAAASAFWVGNEVATDWSVTESPAAIFMANGRTIFTVSLSSDGDVPVLNAAVVAAEVPEGEIIQAIRYYLGFMVIVTNQGVRIGIVDSDSFSGVASIVYGPLVVEWTSSACRTVGAQSKYVWVTGTRTGDSVPQIFRINLGEPTTEEGLYAYAVEDTPYTAGATNDGVCFWTGTPPAGSRAMLVWADNMLKFQDTEYAASGTLQTGFHRFGTLEQKAYTNIRVKLDGEGAVAVSLVLKGGAVQSLISLTVAGASDQDVRLNLPTPQEFIGILFTLSRGALGGTPVLLGYQLRAMPAPSRNRLIQVPLQCRDYESDRSGVETGYDGYAWTRLNALEEMERQSGELTYQDFRNGEQGQCAIEKVQFFNKTPPSPQSAGFGGTVLLTLRKFL